MSLLCPLFLYFLLFFGSSNSFVYFILEIPATVAEARRALCIICICSTNYLTVYLLFTWGLVLVLRARYFFNRCATGSALTAYYFSQISNEWKGLLFFLLCIHCLFLYHSGGEVWDWIGFCHEQWILVEHLRFLLDLNLGWVGIEWWCCVCDLPEGTLARLVRSYASWMKYHWWWSEQLRLRVIRLIHIFIYAIKYLSKGRELSANSLWWRFAAVAFSALDSYV